MFTKYLLPMLAVAGVTFAVYTVVQARQSPPPSRPIEEPPSRPEKARMIAGAGLVEAQMENIPLGVNVPGVVTRVSVKKGDRVKAGQELFSVDDRELKAQLRVKQAELTAALANMHKLEAAPRPEDVPPAQAAVDEAKARLDDAEAAMGRTEKLYNRQMAPASDLDRDRYAYQAARAAWFKAKAELQRIQKGAWKEDLDIAQAAVDLARSNVESININLQRLTVLAPIDGQVLQLNVKLGQFAAMTWKEPMIVLGNVDRYHLRIDIDENDLPWFKEGARAYATLKGRKDPRFPLEYAYVEPYVIPKQSLTGFNSERVDTRVLQVVYRLPNDGPSHVWVGQQMDVYLEAAKLSSEVAAGGVARAR
jgi:HlyD family secretion protein